MSGTIDSAINDVIVAKQNAIKTEIDFALKAKQLQVERKKGDTVLQLIESNAPRSRSKGVGGSFDGLA